MSLIYGDNFQSYAVGAAPPFGDLVLYSGVIASSIFADSTGLFGQSKSLSLPPTELLVLTTPIYDGTGPFYQQATIFEYIKLNNTTDERGQIITFNNAHGSTNEAISGVRILPDGTLSIVGALNSAFAPNTKVSDYSLLCRKWYLLRVDISFGSNLNFIQMLNCKIYINGVVIAEASFAQSAVFISNVNHLYYNNIWFGGAGGGLNVGGLWVYDVIQADNFYPNPGTPSARLNQGVIELVKKRSLPTGNTRIYEA